MERRRVSLLHLALLVDRRRDALAVRVVADQKGVAVDSRSWCDAHTSHCQSYSASAESSTNCISPAIDRTLPPPTTSIDASLISTQPSAGAVEL